MTDLKTKIHSRSFVAAICVASLSLACVAGAVAYLSSTASEVDNTFTASPGLLNSNPAADAQTPEGGDAAFYLAESKVKQDDSGVYVVDTSATKKVLTNTYDGLIPATDNVKDPAVKLDLGSKVSAYLFIKVDATNMSKVTYTIDSDNWTALSGVSGVYYYTGTGATNGVITGAATASTVEIAGANILEDNKVSVASDATNESLNGATLNFNAYLIQASGFDTASAAWTALDVE